MNPISKSLGALLLISLAVNIYFFLPRRPATPVAIPSNRSAVTTREVSPPVPTVARFDWREVESADYRKYIANLRSIGIPEQTIQDIIVADVGELYKFKWKQQIEKSKAAMKLPTGKQPRAFVRQELEAGAKQLHNEKLALLKELLGADFISDEQPFAVNNSDVERAMLNFLPPEKQEEALVVFRQFDERWNAQVKHFFGNGPIRPENREPYLAFKREKDAAIASVLTPEQKEDYDLRFSQLANFLQHKFQGLPLSESAFAELYQYARKYDDALDFFLSNPGEEFQKPFRDASLDVWKKGTELAGVPTAKPQVPEKTAQRFGF